MINFNKKNKIEIQEQRILKAEASEYKSGMFAFKFPLPKKWGKTLDLTKDDRYLLCTLTKDNEIIIRKVLPEDY